ncbi:MAG: hypothetical protein Q9201_006371 [Fulgogasparrea decipioides]
MGDSIAWERHGFKSLIRGDGFDSQVFTITVGPEARVFTAHAAYLCQSPIFERMCRANFKESQNMRINLPEDDPAVIKAIIQYLYAGNFWGLGIVVPSDSVAEIATESSTRTLDEFFEVATDILATMYITAEKYQLQDLKHLIVNKLKAVTNIRERPIQFFSTAMTIYAGIPDSDDVYRKFFKSSIKHLQNPRSMSKTVRQAFDDCWASGGMLAVDLASITCSRYEEELAEKHEALSKKQAQIERLERKHAEQLSKCRDHSDRMVNGNAGSILVSVRGTINI